LNPFYNLKYFLNCKLIKKAETKNHHQIILGNHEFSGKRLEEKSEKGKTGEVMNTTMDENSFGTLLMDDPGDVDLHAGLWWTDVDCAMRSYVHDYGG